jgi:hypothetical protein
MCRGISTRRRADGRASDDEIEDESGKGAGHAPYHGASPLPSRPPFGVTGPCNEIPDA